jgi:Zn finger protein HypA/HybF involved in hydrogenase expression
MTALKFNRFSLSELNKVNIRCRKCGAGHMVNMDSDRLSVNRCPSCGEPYGNIVEDVFYRLQDAHKAMSVASKIVDIEFDIPEE